MYSAHSTRAVSTSAAASAGVSLKVILKAAGWSGEHIFHRFYRRQLEPNFGQKVLDGVLNKHI